MRRVTERKERAKDSVCRTMETAIRSRLGALALLVALLVALLLSVPGLRPVVDALGDMRPGWIAVAVALEVLSCLSFVVVFRLFFPGVPARAARRLAWSEMGSGALLPGGGVVGVAVGGWLLRLAGMPTDQVVRRSSGLFFLTSGASALALAGAGVAGVAFGPHDLARSGLPIVGAVAATLGVLALPALTRRLGVQRGWRADAADGIVLARRALVRPRWRVLGALGYLLFDIAVLWATFAALGVHAPLAALVLAYVIGYLGNLVPLPGGVGVLDAGLVGALVLYGLPATDAGAAVLVYHAIAFWIPGAGGALAYGLLRRRLADAVPGDPGSASARRASDPSGPCNGRPMRPAAALPARLPRDPHGAPSSLSRSAASPGATPRRAT